MPNDYFKAPRWDIMIDHVDCESQQSRKDEPEERLYNIIILSGCMNNREMQVALISVQVIDQVIER